MELYVSRDVAYKKPYGAVEAKTEVFLSIRPPRGLGILRAFFCGWTDDGRYYELPMVWQGLSLGHDIYGITYQTPENACLVWYRFRVESKNRIWYLVRGGSGHGFLADTPGAAWQLTVYEPDRSACGWYGEGITYHIFVDRFRREKIPKESGCRAPRTVHENWEDIPIFRPNEQGVILNNDFFGGSLQGILEALPRLAELSVKTIFLSPIFEAFSNHRYDTGDYKKIDPMLGTEEDFKALCAAAARLGMRVLLDGVFSHTGSDSRYFNRYGHYEDVGAYQSMESPYSGWYSFTGWPDEYSSWWGIRTLPQVNEMNESYRSFLFGEDGVVRYWMRAGASGWRLDVADELPDEFIALLSKAVREEKADAVLIGEVWEDATTKISYDIRRQYVINGALDGVMNYPLRNAILNFMAGGDAAAFAEEMETIRENYPRHVFYSLMNHIGTHDTPRILTLLGCNAEMYHRDKGERAAYRLSAAEKNRGAVLLRLAALIQYAFPGSPCLYYGDEAGMEGFEDPLNRRTYPWRKESADLLGYYQTLGKLRKAYAPLQKGDLLFHVLEKGCLAFSRIYEGQTITAVINRTGSPCRINLSREGRFARDLLSGRVFMTENGKASIPVLPLSGMLIL